MEYVLTVKWINEVAKNVTLTASLGWAAFAYCKYESTQGLGFLSAAQDTALVCLGLDRDILEFQALTSGLGAIHLIAAVVTQK